MSALWIPIHVTRTLNVPTVRGLTAVLANKDLLEMEHPAKVGNTVSKLFLEPRLNIPHDKILIVCFIQLTPDNSNPR